MALNTLLRTTGGGSTGKKTGSTTTTKKATTTTAKRANSTTTSVNSAINKGKITSSAQQKAMTNSNILSNITSNGGTVKKVNPSINYSYTNKTNESRNATPYYNNAVDPTVKSGVSVYTANQRASNAGTTNMDKTSDVYNLSIGLNADGTSPTTTAQANKNIQTAKDLLDKLKGSTDDGDNSGGGSGGGSGSYAWSGYEDYGGNQSSWDAYLEYVQNLRNSLESEYGKLRDSLNSAQADEENSVNSAQAKLDALAEEYYKAQLEQNEQDAKDQRNQANLNSFRADRLLNSQYGANRSGLGITNRLKNTTSLNNTIAGINKALATNNSSANLSRYQSKSNNASNALSQLNTIKSNYATKLQNAYSNYANQLNSTNSDYLTYLKSIYNQ